MAPSPSFSSKFIRCPAEYASIAASVAADAIAVNIASPSDKPLSKFSFNVLTYALDPINNVLVAALPAVPIPAVNAIIIPESAILIPVSYRKASSSDFSLIFKLTLLLYVSIGLYVFVFLIFCPCIALYVEWKNASAPPTQPDAADARDANTPWLSANSSSFLLLSSTHLLSK